VGRNLDAHLAKFGGTRVCDHGEGDDDACLEDDFMEWKKTMWVSTKRNSQPITNLLKR
jgi:sulfite reductase alpha subunit-like flavoprotein